MTTPAPFGLGKLNRPRNRVIYEISRSEVESRDFTRFLGTYGLDRLPTGRKLQAMMNTLIIVLDGYNDDPREIPTIPEVRQFYAAFREVWPYWLYFCDLRSEFLGSMVLSCLPSIDACKVDQKPITKIEYSPFDLADFVFAHFEAMNAMTDRAGMSLLQNYQRTKDVFGYFHLPFDAPPPV